MELDDGCIHVVAQEKDDEYAVGDRVRLLKSPEGTMRIRQKTSSTMGSKRSYLRYGLLFFLLAHFISQGYAQESVGTFSPKKPEGEGPGRRLLVMPYPFYNSTIGTGLGLACIAEGYGQERMLTVGTGLVSAQGTYMLFLMVRNFRAPFCRRLIIDPQTSVGRFENIKSYILDNPNFPGEDAGSNDSSQDNYIELESC